jgi:THO complex subunit 2
MDLQPVLQFIVNRLMDNQIGDLTILDRLISIMSGVSQVENDAISTDQVQAYAGGRELVKEAFYSTTLTINRPVEGAEFGAKAKEAPFDRAKSTKKSLPRLVAALRDTALAVPIWIALAKVRQESMENLEEEPIKVMSMMQDTVSPSFPVDR